MSTQRNIKQRQAGFLHSLAGRNLAHNTISRQQPVEYHSLGTMGVLILSQVMAAGRAWMKLLPDHSKDLFGLNVDVLVLAGEQG